MLLLINNGAAGAINMLASILNIPPWSLPMIEPPAKTTSEAIRRREISKILSNDVFWQQEEITTSVKGHDAYNAKKKKKKGVGFEISKDEELLINMNSMIGEQSSSTSSSKPATYGEITELGARQLFSYMDITSSSKGSDDFVTFYDLGSGVGKLVFQVYMECTDVKRVVGIELSTTRYNIGKNIWGEISDDATKIRNMKYNTDGTEDTSDGDDNRLLSTSSSLKLLHGDLFDVDLSDATHVYVSSLCFTDTMLQRLADKLLSEGTSLKCIASLKPFPRSFEKAFSGGHEAELVYVQMSWTLKPPFSGCGLYIYRRSY